MLPTVRQAVDDTARRLAAAGIATARLDARLLVADALGGGVETIVGHPERRLTAAERHRLSDRAGCRAARRPMAQVLGRREFWSLTFRVTADTLTPRPESETLIEAIVDRTQDPRAVRAVLDLGTGTGCLLLALLHEMPTAWGLGLDASAAALAVAAENARRLGLADRAAFVAGDWARAVVGQFDVVMANPPYVADGDLVALEPEVARYEPRLALSGGADGFAAYRRLVPDIPRILAPGGVAVLEVGAGQCDAVVGIVRDAGLQRIEIVNDLAGIGRCVVGRAAGTRRGGKKEVGTQEVPD